MAAPNRETLEQYLDYPLMAPPPGVTPNFVNPDSTAYQVYITAGVCIPLMLFFSATRFLSKNYMGRKTIIWEEAIFYTGLVLSLCFMSIAVVSVSGSVFGRNAWDVLLRSYTRQQMILTYTFEFVLPLAICMVKVSVLVLYLHVFGLLRWMRIAVTAGIVVLVAFHLSISIGFISMCAPARGTSQIDYLLAFTSPTCARTSSMVVIQGVGNVVADLFLMVLPLPGIWSLQITFKRKLGISAMMSVGLCGVASSIVGLVYRVGYYQAGTNKIRHVSPVWSTMMAEAAAAVVVCCMPTTAAFFRSIKETSRSWLSSSSRRFKSSGSSGAMPLSDRDPQELAVQQPTELSNRYTFSQFPAKNRQNEAGAHRGLDTDSDKYLNATRVSIDDDSGI